jgi:hypothetical protein
MLSSITFSKPNLLTLVLLPLCSYLSADGRRGASSFVECLKVAMHVLPLSGCLAAQLKKDAGTQSIEPSSTEQDLNEKGQEANNKRRSLKAGDAASADGATTGIVGVGDRCRVDGVEVPALTGAFLAVENLFWTAKALGLHSEATLQVWIRVPFFRPVYS